MPAASPATSTAIKNDTAAWNAVNIFASHEYGCGTLPSQPAIAAAGKEYWETEVDTGTGKGDSTGDGIASALLMATTIHNDLTKANLNAWHLWWLYEPAVTGGCLYDTSTKMWTKRLWVMGNYSRFVRPGYMRVSTSGTAPSGVLLSAYQEPGGWNRGRGGHQQQHGGHPALALRFGQPCPAASRRG